MERSRRAAVEALTAAAARFDELAELAELMDDQEGADRFRELAATRYSEAMPALDVDER